MPRPSYRKKNDRADAASTLKKPPVFVEPPEQKIPDEVRNTALDIRDDEIDPRGARSDVSLIRQAIESRHVTLHSMPADYVDGFVRTLWTRFERAVRQNNDAFVGMYGKLLQVVEQENRKKIEMMDKMQRLDDGKPTSITANPTPELLAKIERIYSARRTKRVENVAPQGPMDEIMRAATEDES